CEPVCPAHAIFFEHDVPDEGADYTQANADFFAKLGSPGGAGKAGKLADDPPWSKDLPPQQRDCPLPGPHLGGDLAQPVAHQNRALVDDDVAAVADPLERVVVRAGSLRGRERRMDRRVVDPEERTDRDLRPPALRTPGQCRELLQHEG